jgi:hypothetical protein
MLLHKRIKMVQTLRANMLSAVEAWEEAIEKGVPGTELSKLKKEASETYKVAIATYLVIYPTEEAFGGKATISKADNEEASKATTVPQQDVPGLRGIHESRPKMVKAQVHTVVKKFLKHFELAFKVAEVDVQMHYGEYLEWCLGKSYEAYLKSKREAMVEDIQETWSMVKEWLLEFKDTPVQQIRSINALTMLTWKPMESSGAFGQRFKELLDNHSAEKFSVEQLLAALAMKDASQKLGT